jgi:hypothetical protein
MYDDDDFIPPGAFGNVDPAIETYGTSVLKRAVVDHVLPDDWQSGDGHGRKVMHVVSAYLNSCQRPDNRERFHDARRKVQRELGVHGRTIRRALGERLYGDEATCRNLDFQQDLIEIERLWKEHMDDVPSRFTE